MSRVETSRPATTWTASAGVCVLSSVTALEECLTLATKNRKHFEMIGDLKVEVPEY
jgi:hypothetical protein